MKPFSLADIGQWIGMLALIAGITLMVWDNRAPGETIIAIASLIYAIATKIKYYRKKGAHHDISIEVSHQKLKGRDSKRGRDKRSELADDDSYGGYFPRLLETGSPARDDGGKPERRLFPRRDSRQWKRLGLQKQTPTASKDGIPGIGKNPEGD
jgi:hypothetical protein